MLTALDPHVPDAVSSDAVSSDAVLGLDGAPAGEVCGRGRAEPEREPAEDPRTLASPIEFR